MGDNDRQVSVSRVIPAPPPVIFDVLTQPSQHAAIDGSGTVTASSSGDERLRLGSVFGMKMRQGLPYRVRNRVTEFDDNRRIGWRHLGGHTWRYELEPVDGGTRVTETFDWSTARVPKFIELAGFPKKHPPAMEQTLERLEQLVTTSAPD